VLLLLLLLLLLLWDGRVVHRPHPCSSHLLLGRGLHHARLRALSHLLLLLLLRWLLLLLGVLRGLLG
jgi:hypothetical protein